jgi:hypothetical protein
MFPVATHAIASLMERKASSNSPASARAMAKSDNQNGMNTVAPVDRHEAVPEVIS